ncbi:holliday junction resolvase [Stylonychia lemnae]|uniref:Holliday junction resolvase n=1 Tax=Stylonychia lemnae TaxID=5949 RepID=A0A078ATZ0_STYLE|nr:holliday junction resolvase [Stylonychia lemnae]|eukprot:CDW85724.1 holliday junction resolvase [Stylonychia lemnae]
MKSQLTKIKKINTEARIIGLDIGRKYIGVAVSDKQIQTCKPYKTFQMDPQFLRNYDFSNNSGFFILLKHLIDKKHVKGIVAGYPLHNKNQFSTHCIFIEKFIEHMWTHEKIRVPVTLVNEYGTSLEAKARVAELVQGKILGTGTSATKNILEEKLNDIKLLQAKQDHQLITNQLMSSTFASSQVSNVQDLTANLEPEVMLRKGIYDKIAAQLILQQFIDIYNKKEDKAVSEKTANKI